VVAVNQSKAKVFRRCLDSTHSLTRVVFVCFAEKICKRLVSNWVAFQRTKMRDDWLAKMKLQSYTPPSAARPSGCCRTNGLCFCRVGRYTPSKPCWFRPCGGTAVLSL
jgi:hypothetical protein